MQWNIRSAYVRSVTSCLAGVVCAVFTGCGVNGSAPPTNYTHPVTLQGQVFAARNYMAGSTVKIYETQPNGVATNGVYVGSAKLLTTTTANTTGGWSVTGLTCTSPDQLYVTAEAGTPYPSGFNSTSLSSNPNSLMMTAIGDCSLLTTTPGTDNVTSIVTNEASTVAAVWALRNFISLSGTTVNVTSAATNYAGTGGVGTASNFAGLAHAFLNANNLSPYKIGNFVQFTNGATDATKGGLVPVQELNSLAYAQYLCTIGGDGTTAGDYSNCTKLYQLATPPGGTAPTNSLQAMLNIANNPANNAAAILAFTLTPIPGSSQTGSQQINAGVYVPALSGFGTLTTDWSVALYYGPGYGASTGNVGSVVPEFVTLDANDNVYFSNPNASTGTAGNVVAISSSGQPLWTSATDSTKLTTPRAIAADQFGNVWVVNGSTAAGSGFVEQINATNGATIQQYPSTSTTLWGVAVDSLGDVWYSSDTLTGQNLHELTKSGSTYTENTTFPIPPASPAYALTQVRPDSKNNIWVAGLGATGGAAVYFPNTGTTAAPTYTAGLMFAPLPGVASTYGIAADASGNAYAVTTGTGNGVYKTTVTGTGASAVLVPTNVAAVTAAASRSTDIDGLGNIWYADFTTGTSLYQFVPSTAKTTAFYPCYNAATTGSSQTCSTGISTRIDFAVDSTGSIWVASYGNGGGGRIVQIIGLAAPTVPLKALGKPGVLP